MTKTPEDVLRELYPWLTAWQKEKVDEVINVAEPTPPAPIAAQTEPEASKFSIGQTVYWQGQIGMCSGKVIEITRPENSGYVLKVELEIGVEMFMTEESVSAQPGATAEPGCKECGEHEIHINHFAFLPGTNLANSKPFHAYETAKPPKPIAAQTEKGWLPCGFGCVQNGEYSERCPYHKRPAREQVDAARLDTAKKFFEQWWINGNPSSDTAIYAKVLIAAASLKQETQPPRVTGFCGVHWQAFPCEACESAASSSPLETPAPLILRCYRCKATLMAKQIAPNEYEIFNLCETCKTTPAPADTGAPCQSGPCSAMAPAGKKFCESCSTGDTPQPQDAQKLAIGYAQEMAANLKRNAERKAATENTDK